MAGTGEDPSSGGRVAVLRSDGAGGFAAPAQYPVSDARGRAVAVGDMTGDGRPDVVVGGEGPTTGGSIAVLAGAGGGALGPAVVTRSGAAHDVELGDLDEDGVLDVVTAEARHFVVSFGDGQGGIAARHVLVAPRDIASDVAVADMTGDGVLDVAGVGIPADPVAIYPNALDGARTHP